MKVLTEQHAMYETAKALRCWILYISITNWPEGASIPDILKAAPYLEKHYNIIINQSGVILCDSEEECRYLYNLTVGEDGPTRLNDYSGQVKVYALIINDKGEPVTENT